MRLFSMEPQAFSARSAARDRVNIQVSASTLTQRPPTRGDAFERVGDVAVVRIAGIMLRRW